MLSYFFVYHIDFRWWTRSDIFLAINLIQWHVKTGENKAVKNISRAVVLGMSAILVINNAFCLIRWLFPCIPHGANLADDNTSTWLEWCRKSVEFFEMVS